MALKPSSGNVITLALVHILTTAESWIYLDQAVMSSLYSSLCRRPKIGESGVHSLTCWKSDVACSSERRRVKSFYTYPLECHNAMEIREARVEESSDLDSIAMSSKAPPSQNSQYNRAFHIRKLTAITHATKRLSSACSGYVQ